MVYDSTGAVVERQYRLDGPQWEPEGRWYRDVFMREESARGLTDTEDLWSAGHFRARLARAGDRMAVSAWAIDFPSPSVRAVIAGSHARATELITRDTMISFEGLFLETGRADEGRELLLAYDQRISQGMLANTAARGSLEFNTVDAALWFVHAIDRYLHQR